MAQPNQESYLLEELINWGVHLNGEWSSEEINRVHAIFKRLSDLGGDQTLSRLFNQQATLISRSNRAGKVGRTRGNEVFLDNDWTDWTLAHELGHRWNNAWSRQPEQILRASLGAGRLEWLKRLLRRFEKWLTRVVKSIDKRANIDWKALWYHPGGGAPPCGVDRNFNSSEDLAESFAATIFPDDAKIRATKAAKRLADFSNRWDWGKDFEIFHLTPRGSVTLQMIRDKLSPEQDPNQTKQSAA